jgi:uncharacterized membrane protein YeaQ/YmgE (transglycosylase-associated protein family)
MNLLFWLLLGALTGWITSKVIGRNTRMGAGANIVVGIIGALIGGLIMNALGVLGVSGFNLSSMLVAVGGAIMLLLIVGWFRWSVQPQVKTQSKSAPPENKIETPKINTQSPTTSSEGKPVSSNTQPQKETGRVPSRSTSITKSGVIFLSYRRTDSAHVAGRIYDRLVGIFGRVSVFKDVDSIPLGLDFKEYLDEKVGECDVLLATIGDGWLDAVDSNGKRRLEDPDDFVRIEIESALMRDIPVIPLLVGGAPMPSQKELPDSLRKLVYRNGIRIRPDPDFHRDMDRLISALKRYIVTDV